MPSRQLPKGSGLSVPGSRKRSGFSGIFPGIDGIGLIYEIFRELTGLYGYFPEIDGIVLVFSGN